MGIHEDWLNERDSLNSDDGFPQRPATSAIDDAQDVLWVQSMTRPGQLNDRPANFTEKVLFVADLATRPNGNTLAHISAIQGQQIRRPTAGEIAMRWFTRP